MEGNPEAPLALRADRATFARLNGELTVRMTAATSGFFFAGFSLKGGAFAG